MSEETKPKKTRKPSRPRLDAVKRAILAGDYDDVLWELKGAIEERNRRRQDAVMKLVKEVWGDEYTVAPPQQPNPAPRPRPGGPVERQPNEILPGDSPHVQEITDPLGDEEDDALGPDHESHSPVIGSIE